MFFYIGDIGDQSWYHVTKELLPCCPVHWKHWPPSVYIPISNADLSWQLHIAKHFHQINCSGVFVHLSHIHAFIFLFCLHILFKPREKKRGKKTVGLMLKTYTVLCIQKFIFIPCSSGILCFLIQVSFVKRLIDLCGGEKTPIQLSQHRAENCWLRKQ